MSTETRRTGLDSALERFDERASEARRRPWRRAGLALLVVAVLAGGAWVVGWSPALAVRHVEVSGVTGAEAQAVLAAADVPVGTPMLRLDTAPLVERVAARPTVSDVSVERAWPSTVVVHVVPRTPVMVARTSSGLRLVDDQGVAYATVTAAPRGLPQVTATGTRALTPEALIAAARVHSSLPESLRVRTTAITVASRDLVTLTIGTTKVLWGGPDDATTKVAVVNALLPTRPRTIDVSVPARPVTT